MPHLRRKRQHPRGQLAGDPTVQGTGRPGRAAGVGMVAGAGRSCTWTGANCPAAASLAADVRLLLHRPCKGQRGSLLAMHCSDMAVQAATT